MACIKKIKIDDKIYTANVSYKTAIKCNEIATDNMIGDFERLLGILCTVFGEEGIEIPDHYEKLINWIKDYLSCGKEIEETKEEPDMDFVQDMEYIEASFMSDFGIDLEKEDMSWSKFNKLINGLSNSEFGNCCVLNRVRNLRNTDPRTIKDKKEREKLIEAQKKVALKKNENKLTDEQIKSAEELYNSLGL